MRCRCSSPDVGVLFYPLYQFLVFVSIVGGGSGDAEGEGVAVLGGTGLVELLEELREEAVVLEEVDLEEHQGERHDREYT